MSDDLQEEKRRLALCLRMLEREGIMDYNGHASIRIGADRLLINAGGAPRSRLTAEDICTIDLDGTLLEGRGTPPLEFHLHAGIYRARSDVGAVVHAHPQWSTYLTMTGHGYHPVYAQGALAHPANVLDTPDSINSPEIAARLAGVLAGNTAALMKSHGAVTVGADIREAFVLMNYLEENARRQYMAMQIGTPYVFAEEECARFRQRLRTPSLFGKAWDHFQARLDGPEHA